jgi:hypothetical protein
MRKPCIKESFDARKFIYREEVMEAVMEASAPENLVELVE